MANSACAHDLDFGHKCQISGKTPSRSGDIKKLYSGLGVGLRKVKGPMFYKYKISFTFTPIRWYHAIRKLTKFKITGVFWEQLQMAVSAMLEKLHSFSYSHSRFYARQLQS